jgi:hypothetical protein
MNDINENYLTISNCNRYIVVFDGSTAEILRERLKNQSHRSSFPSIG